MSDPVKLTPMFEQYLRIKEQHPDSLLFYRMGDFYELFFEDAKIASRELQIALTTRSRVPGHEVPMCGVPWHASQSYIAQLIDKGYVVAICEQVTDPKTSKGLVERSVTHVITPGTVLEESNLEAHSHNYLGCVLKDPEEQRFAFVWADLSTALWTGTEFSKTEDLWQWVVKMAPRELLLDQNLTPPPLKYFEAVHQVPLQSTSPKESAFKELINKTALSKEAATELTSKPLLCQACVALSNYFEKTQSNAFEQLAPFLPFALSRRMLIDETTERNLEIFRTISGQKGKGTLRHVLDKTLTPMGGRLLEEMLHHPWRELEPINEIQKAVGFFAADDSLRRQLRNTLASMNDLERLIQRITLNRSTPRDFLALRTSLALLPKIKALLQEKNAAETDSFLSRFLANWPSLEDVTDLLERSLVADPPLTVSDGGLFKQGYDPSLDTLLDLVEHGEQKLNDLLETEKTRSNLPKLKMGFNRVFGYYYELSRAQQSPPAHFVRRQSLANAERFTTEELKALEESLLTASEQRKSLEYELFKDLRQKVSQTRERIFAIAERIAHLDYWLCLAEVGRANDWSFPTFTKGTELSITNGMHPVLASLMGKHDFVPNDIHLAPAHSFCLVTGPNMAGKSTILRQTALICLLAQMGSMVPAQSATLGLVDRLFSRVGASDNLAQGASTFMVEMTETARILRSATKQSLVILDEIGRGTSTFDGVALAWAIVEYLVRRHGGVLRTIFATHYHELTSLEGLLNAVFTMNVAIQEYNGSILFLHKLLPGPSDRSYGIEVARLAGIPGPCVQRARTLLAEFEGGRKAVRTMVEETAHTLLPGLTAPPKKTQPKKAPVPTHPLLDALNALDPETISPVQALNLLLEWKRRFGNKKSDVPQT